MNAPTPRILFCKANSRHGPDGRVAPGAALPSSAEITTLEQAKAYWRVHFVGDGQPKEIRCKYGKHTYPINVVFTRNHAYTENTTGSKRDEDRTFDLKRAQSMQFIFRVLQYPAAITWSATTPSNKQFDSVLTIADPHYGRVILRPTPTADDLEQNRVSHFEFVSWHLPNQSRHQIAARIAQRERITPTTMKKADTGSAFFPSLGHRPEKGKTGRLQKGIPFNWDSLLQAMPDSHETQIAPDGLTWDSTDFTPSPGAFAPLLKRMATPTGARWITVHPGGATRVARASR